jgi:hypothetical protein
MHLFEAPWQGLLLARGVELCCLWQQIVPSTPVTDPVAETIKTAAIANSN